MLIGFSHIAVQETFPDYQISLGTGKKTQTFSLF